MCAHDHPFPPTAEGLRLRVFRTACAGLDPAELRRMGLGRLAAAERLAVPERLVSFPVTWTDDADRVCVSMGYYAAGACIGPYRGGVVLRGGLDGDETAALAFLRLLESALCEPRGGGLVFGADAEPDQMSDGESMRFCAALAQRLRRFVPDAGITAEMLDDAPERERGYLLGALRREGLLRPCAADGPALPSGRAVGYGLCQFALEALRRAGGGTLWGRTVAVYGRGAAADSAAETAARLGARVTRPGVYGGAARLHFLCDAAMPLGASDAEALLEADADGVFEGAPLACTPEAAALLAKVGVPFAPSVAAGAGASVLRGHGEACGAWEAERIVRRGMRDILDAVWREGSLYPGAYTAALRRAAGALRRFGV